MIDCKTAEFTADNLLEWLNHRPNHPGQLEHDIRCWAERDLGMDREESVELGSEEPFVMEGETALADLTPVPEEPEGAEVPTSDEADETDSV